MTETTNATTETTTPETTKPTAPKPQKTATITLAAADGATLQLVAERKGEGARTFVITTDAAKKSERGMSEAHPTFEAATAATEKMATKAEKLGWKRRQARRGFVAKADAFTTLPAAPKAKK